ncbi:MAG: AAA family ATPase [Armatimonadia bacterium]
MIIQSLHIRDWRKLGEVNVERLSPTLTIIHAPNKTGKTSLVEALRCALVDFEYDTSRIRPIVPWGTSAVPEVSVGFQVRGASYLLTKRFTNRKEGGAELRWVISDPSRQEPPATGKDATRKARELLGITNSDSGLAQLLWVDQGIVDLPVVDEDLDRTLRPLLGSVISGSDLDFRRLLWERMKDWFSSEEAAAQGNCRKGSRPVALAQAIEEREQEVGEITAELRSVDELLAIVERKEAALVEAAAAVDASKRELETLRATDRELAEKRRKAAEIGNLVVRARETLAAASEALDTCRKRRESAETCRDVLDTAQQDAEPLRTALAGAEKKLDAAVAAREEAQKQIMESGKRQTQVEAMGALLRLDSDLTRTDGELARTRTVAAELAHSEAALAKLSTPNDSEFRKIRILLDRLVQLDAELRAAQLGLEVEAVEGGPVKLTLDGGETEHITLQPGEGLERLANQHLRVDIDGFGAVRVVRGREDQGVEALAKEQADLAQNLKDTQVKWGLGSVAKPEIIPELTRRRTEKDSLAERVQRLKKTLDEIAPEGLQAMEAQLASLRQQRQGLLELNPGLEVWQPSAAEYEAALAEVKALREHHSDTAQLAAAVEAEAKKQVDTARGRVQAAEQQVEAANIELAKAEALRDAHTREHCGEEALVQGVQARGQELEVLQLQFDQHKLTEDEKRIPEALEAEEEALENRRNRLNGLQQDLADLTGQLKSKEGLHSRRTAAEQALSVARREHERLALEVDAHLLLWRLFDQIRDESVEKSIRPVSELVGAWLNELDGAGHRVPVFGSDLAVESLATGPGGSLPVKDATSYGEREQLSTLVRLAYGAVMAQDEPQVVILDDPLAHADAFRHGRMLNVIRDASRRNLQIIIMTCHPERFDHLKDAVFVDLERPAAPAGTL